MQVTLLGAPQTIFAEQAAVVCRNSSNDPKKILENALKIGHANLLEYININFELRGVSRALTHQLVRHRIASFAQESQRHVKISINSIEWYVAPASAVPLFHTAMHAAGQSYLECIEQGMPIEDARYLLPNGCTTNINMNINARSLDNFFKLRCCMHAQWEIRQLAFEMLKCIRPYLKYFKNKKYPDCPNCLEPCNQK